MVGILKMGFKIFCYDRNTVSSETKRNYIPYFVQYIHDYLTLDYLKLNSPNSYCTDIVCKADVLACRVENENAMEACTTCLK